MALIPDVRLLADHFVSPRMIEDIRNTIPKKVGWLQVSEIKVCFIRAEVCLQNISLIRTPQDPKGRLTAEDTKVLWPMLLDSLPDLVALEGFVVAKSLNAELVQMSRVVVSSQAETDWRRDVQSGVVEIARAVSIYHPQAHMC